MSINCKNTNVRNIGIISHIDAGKTTTSERILFYTGYQTKIGEVHAGEATMDYLVQERERGITIQSASTRCIWKDINFNLIDTPGHLDFNIEVERTLRIMDGAITILDAVAGVEPQTLCVWKQASKYNVSRICYINKMDRIGANFNKSCREIKDKLSNKAVVINFPYFKNDIFEGVIDVIESKLITWDDNKIMYKNDIPDTHINDYKKYQNLLYEHLAHHDDEFMNEYLKDNNVNKSLVYDCIRSLCIKTMIFPIMCGSSFKNKGIEPLLDSVNLFLPNPFDKTNYCINNNNKEPINADLYNPEDFCGFVFKTMTDQFLGSIAFCRIYSGTLNKGVKIFNTRTKKYEKISKIIRLFANKKEYIESAWSGDIIAISMKDTVTGDTLLGKASNILLEKIDIPEPVVEISVIPNSKEDQIKMSAAIDSMAKDDPTLVVGYNNETKQWILKGIGELHLEVTVQRLKTEKGVNLTMSKPNISYRETITKFAKTEYQHKKQTGGAGQYAYLVMTIEPSDTKEFEFVNKIVGGAIPKGYIPEIENSAKSCMLEGPLTKSKVINVKVTLLDGKFHEVDSSALAFGIATRYAMKELFKNAGVILLEPIAELIVNTPCEFYNTIASDLSSKGLITAVEEDDEGKYKEIHCKIAMAKLFGYSNTVRSLSKGMATFNHKFLEYRECNKEVYSNLNIEK